MPQIPLFGPYGALDSPSADSGQLVNIYPELIESGQGKGPGRVVSKPGIATFALIGPGPIRAIWMGDGRMLVISGSEVHEVFADSSGPYYGDVENDGKPAQIISNGTQILIVSNGWAWTLTGSSTNTAGSVAYTNPDTHVTVYYTVAHAELTDATYTDLGIGVLAWYMDLVIDATDPAKVTSVFRPFTATDVGQELMITGGTGFTVPMGYVITSVDPATHAATLTGAAGTTGSTGGIAQELSTAANNIMTVASQTIPFTAADVATLAALNAAGDQWYLDITVPPSAGSMPDTPPGPEFTAGTYTIVSIDPVTGLATLDRSPGTPGTINGAGRLYEYLHAQTGTYQDGYGIVAPPKSATFYISALHDFTSWSSLDEGVKEGYPDHIQALLSDHEELYIFGDLQSTEVWQDTGAANFPFERQMGAFMHYGAASPYCVAQLGIWGIAWLGWSTGRGNIVAYYAQGFQPERISTHALEIIWRDYVGQYIDATLYSYTEDGHDFLVIDFPAADATWVYDRTASLEAKTPMWHQRTWWDGTKHHRQRQCCHCFGYLNPYNGSPAWTSALTHYVGDYATNQIYVQAPNYGNDDGAPIMRVRIFPHSSNGNLRTFWHRFRLEGEFNGVTINPTLDYSRDGGWNYVNPKSRNSSKMRLNKQTLDWWRLGASWDIIWRLTISDDAKVSLTNAYFEASQGSS